MTELSTSPQPGEAKALPASWVEKIFAKLTAKYGAQKMQAAFDGCSIEMVKAEWADGLAGFTGEELLRGLNACNRRPWPPMLPEFIAMCRPAMDYEAAYTEAVQQMRYRHSSLEAERQRERWSHPAVFWAAARMGSDLTAYRYEQVKNRWAAALDTAFAEYDTGKLPREVPKAAAALPPPKSTMTEEERAANIKALHDLLAGVGKPKIQRGGS